MGDELGWWRELRLRRTDGRDRASARRHELLRAGVAESKDNNVVNESIYINNAYFYI